jgi:hypothetical protein
MLCIIRPENAQIVLDRPVASAIAQSSQAAERGWIRGHARSARRVYLCLRSKLDPSLADSKCMDRRGL